MDFLVLFLFYLAFVLMGVVMICICTKTQRLKGLVLGGAQMCSCVVPQPLQRAVQRLLHHLFHTRNHAFVVLHLVLQGLVYSEYTWEVFSYCQGLEFSLHYLLLPYLLLTVNLVFFTLTCSANPGTITKANELLLLQVYEFDEMMFPKNARCFTCDLRKPARSKHCTSAATLAILSTAFLVRLVVVSDLYQKSYIDDLGQFQAVDTFFLIQHLFLTFPRIIFLLGFVLVLSLLLAGYLCFVLYLAATNQTTNEWCRGDWAWCQHCPLGAWSPSAEPQVHQNIHSHGLWSNLREIFLPAAPCYERKKR
ncbi:probable palmitoyltransferase ZDHHC4 isoform X2 [Nannospalax galili]|uniref:probable palmitoyltransferase ZDHHC4 isoform X2 n=1 Tax=Nannospalax galili TaxID=1026970 RepID=UPI000819C802|nr:probable palmitoyltransferase ZDHHC4 isoform X2 [Nannospalax galili]